MIVVVGHYLDDRIVEWIHALLGKVGIDGRAVCVGAMGIAISRGWKLMEIASLVVEIDETVFKNRGAKVTCRAATASGYDTMTIGIYVSCSVFLNI